MSSFSPIHSHPGRTANWANIAKLFNCDAKRHILDVILQGRLNETLGPFPLGIGFYARWKSSTEHRHR
jgi:hypothetical protein